MEFDFPAQVKSDIVCFMKESHELFFNEMDFQIHLALHLLLTGHYDDVDVEYYIPYQELGEYNIWKNEMYLDIVVRRGCEYIPIELKYPTKKITQDITRFNESISTCTIVKDQGAHNIVMYNFWKDVRRIELVKKRFASVTAGFAVWLTNDSSYWRERRDDAVCREMSTAAGIHNRSRHWHNSKKQDDHPDFDLDNEYYVEWTNASNLTDFKYCIIEIK